MDAKDSEHRQKPTWLPWIWLGIATLLAVFSNGRWILPVATWIAPVFFLRYIHSQKPLPGLVLGGLAMAAVHVIAWQDMTPLDNVALYITIFSWIGILFWVPYCVDRLLAPCIHGFASTLVFPLAFASVELIYTLVNPFLSNGSIAYTQYSLLWLVQIASITGLWGITFLVTWTASVIHWAWERGFAWGSVRRGIGLWVGVLVVVFLFGQGRLILVRPRLEPVRVAAVAATAQSIEQIRAAGENPDQALEHYQAVLNDYLDRTRQEAIGGARIVAWDELAIRMAFDQELAFVRQGQELARETEIYLLMTLRVQDIETSPDAPRRQRKNEAVLIGPDGEVIWEYLKSFPTPGDREIQGDGVVPTVETPLGKLAASICFDADNPGFIRQAGRADVGLMLNPAWNHEADAPLQLRMAVFRAVENGFSLLRPTREGFSAVADSRGRLVAVSKTTPADGILVTDVPIESRPTLYPVIGDLFGWLCVAGIVIMIVWGAVVGGLGPRNA